MIACIQTTVVAIIFVKNNQMVKCDILGRTRGMHFDVRQGSKTSDLKRRCTIPELRNQAVPLCIS